MEEIFSGVEYQIYNKGKEFEYNGMEYDSRKIKNGNIFVALEGAIVDGHNYIENAIENGAKMVITSKEIKITNKRIIYVLVKNLRKKLGKIASNFYNWPQNQIKIIGVTGTNGKTTTTYIIEHIIGNCARFGTIDYKIGDEIIPAVNTTPESLDIVKMLKRAVDKKIEFVVMEVSSHSLDLGRVDMLKFDSAVFTNLSQDHLNFHKTMENYFDAKTKLFDKLKLDSVGVINIDNKWGKKLKSLFTNAFTYSEKKGKLTGEILEYRNDSMEISIKYNDKEYKFITKLMGEFNLYNIMGAFSCCIRLNFNPEYIVEKLKTIETIPGRFETVNLGQNFMVVVDYAHTDDGLLNILRALEKIKTKRIITVFGAGGDRDKTKRPKMAYAASKFSDYVFVTSDNPRTEDPEAIINDVEKGLEEIGYSIANYEKILDRESAIKKSIEMAEQDDIILIAGKGHETYQVMGTEKIHFDDKEIAAKYVKGQSIDLRSYSLSEL